MKEINIDWVVYLFTAFIVAIGVLLISILYRSYEHQQVANKLEAETGCVYLGSVRDMSSIGFFDCDNVIVLRKLYED